MFVHKRRGKDKSFLEIAHLNSFPLPHNPAPLNLDENYKKLATFNFIVNISLNFLSPKILAVSKLTLAKRRTTLS